MRKILSTPVLLLVAMFTLIGFSMNVQAAENFKPYEYEFTKGAGEKLNEMAPLKKMEITFDESIAELKPLADHLSVREAGNTDKLNIIDSAVINGKTLSIAFKNIDFIDYTTVKNLELVIDKETLQQSQAEHVLPLKIEDILPGFETLFIDGDAEKINTQIFKFNAPRDIFVHVRPAYIEQIETIHRNEGIVTEKPGKHLTNIDIIANETANRLKVGFNNDDQFSRDIARHDVVKGFTMGQAGIDEYLEGDNEGDIKSFDLKAYSAEGRLLEKRKFALRVIDPTNNFTYNGYLPKPDKIFGQVVTLYDLMADAKQLGIITERIPVEELNAALSISYKHMNNPTPKVTNLEQLELALKNEAIKTIDLQGVQITEPIMVKRNVTIKNGELQDVTLGDGSEDLTIRLDGVRNTGDLTIDVGAGGTAIIDGSPVTGATTIVSGGVNSVYFYDFKKNGEIRMENETPVRIVFGYSNQSTDNHIQMTLASNKEVAVEGIAGALTVGVAEQVNAQLKVSNSHKASSILVGTMGEGARLALEHQRALTIPNPLPDSWTAKELDAVIEAGKEVVEMNYGTLFSKAFGEWETGVDLTELAHLDGLPSGIQLEVENPKAFGADWTVSYADAKLKIAGPETLKAEATEVILKGEDDQKIYKVKLSVTVE